MGSELIVECAGRGANLHLRARGDLAVVAAVGFFALAVTAWALWLLV